MLKIEEKKKEKAFSPVLTPEAEFFDFNLVLLHDFVALKCRICISKKHPAIPTELKIPNLVGVDRGKQIQINQMKRPKMNE